MWKNLLLDFILGGGLIALVVGIAHFIGATIAGLVAALPFRLGVSLLLIWFHQGEEEATKAIGGTLYGLLGAFVFVLSLYFLAQKFRFLESLIMATGLCTVATVAAYYLME